MRVIITAIITTDLSTIAQASFFDCLILNKKNKNDHISFYETFHIILKKDIRALYFLFFGGFVNKFLHEPNFFLNIKIVFFFQVC